MKLGRRLVPSLRSTPRRRCGRVRSSAFKTTPLSLRHGWKARWPHRTRHAGSRFAAPIWPKRGGSVASPTLAPNDAPMFVKDVLCGRRGCVWHDRDGPLAVEGRLLWSHRVPRRLLVGVFARAARPTDRYQDNPCVGVQPVSEPDRAARCDLLAR